MRSQFGVCSWGVLDRGIGRAMGLAAMLLVVLAAMPARAQQVVLAWKWVEGDERRYVIESTMKHTIGREGPTDRNDEKPRRVESTHIFDVVERVPDVDDAGVATVTRLYQRVRVHGTDSGEEGDGPGGIDRFEYDSALRTGAGGGGGGGGGGRLGNPRPGGGRPGGTRPTAEEDELHPWVAPYAALAGKTITFRVDAEGHVLSCTGADEMMENVFDSFGEDGQASPLLALFKAGVNNDMLAAEFESAMNLIPGRVVRRGESWNLGFSQTLPLVGELRTSMECRLTGVRGREPRVSATITNKGGMTLEGGAAGVQGLGGLFQVNLGMSDMDGTTEFDAAGGYITSQRQRSVSEWEIYAPDFSDPNSLGESVKTTHRIEQDVSMRLER